MQDETISNLNPTRHFLSAIINYIAQYEFALVYYILALRAGKWHMEIGRTRKESRLFLRK